MCAYFYGVRCTLTQVLLGYAAHTSCKEYTCQPITAQTSVFSDPMLVSSDLMWESSGLTWECASLTSAFSYLTSVFAYLTSVFSYPMSVCRGRFACAQAQTSRRPRPPPQTATIDWPSSGPCVTPSHGCRAIDDGTRCHRSVTCRYRRPSRACPVQAAQMSRPTPSEPSLVAHPPQRPSCA